MYRRTIHSALGLSMAIWLGLAGCAADSDVADLSDTLQSERETALVAEIVGPDGGRLQVASGPYAGTGVEIPAGALSKEAVFSISVTDGVPSGLGYTVAGEMAHFYATALQFNEPLTIIAPVDPAVMMEGVESRIVLLERRDGVYRPVAGAVFDGQRTRALVSRLGDYGVAVAAERSVTEDDLDTETRCSAITGAVAMDRAIRSAENRLALQADYFPDPKLLTVQAEGMNACGYSTTWETRWYTTTANVAQRTADVTYTSSGSSEPVFSKELPCDQQQLVSLSPTTNLTGLADDFFERLLEEPQELWLTTLSCEDGQSPPRFVIEETTTGQWARYSTAGVLVDSSF